MKLRIISILTAAALLLSLAACGKQPQADTTGAAAAEPNATYSGTVSAISTKSITLSTDSGEVTIPLTDATAFLRTFSAGGQQPGGMIDGPGGMGGGMLEIPEGTGGMLVPPVDGEADGSMEVPPEGADNATPPEMPDGGTFGDMEQGATIAAVFIGASVTVITDENGAAASVSVADMGAMQRPGNMG